MIESTIGTHLARNASIQLKAVGPRLPFKTSIVGNNLPILIAKHRRIQFWTSEQIRTFSDLPDDITHLSFRYFLLELFEDSEGCEEFIKKQFMLEMQCFFFKY